MSRRPLDPQEERLRVRALELAVQAAVAWPGGGDPLAYAEPFYAFLTGQSGQSPRQRILDAMEDAGVH